MTHLLTALAIYLIWGAVSVTALACLYAWHTRTRHEPDDTTALAESVGVLVPALTLDQIRARQVYAAVPELRSLPVEDSGPLAVTVAQIHALPTYRGGQR